MSEHATPPGSPAGGAGYRLSPQQRRLWSLMGGSPGSPYRSFAAARIEGALDPALLEAALAEIVARHEVLRTLFPVLPGLTVPVQAVQVKGSLALERHDLAGLSPAEQAPRLAELRRELGDAALPPAEGPLLRFQLVSLGPRAHALHVVASALAADVRSLENLLCETAQGYARRAGHAPADAPPAEVMQYPDIAEVLNDLLESPETEAGRRRWQELSLPERDAALPAEIAPPGEAGLGPRTQPVAVDARALEALSQRHATSPAVVLLAAWQVLLWRLVGRRPFALGMTHEGRSYEGLDKALGPFERHVPLGVTLDPSESFVRILPALERTLEEARELSDYYAPPAVAPDSAPRIAFGYSVRRAAEIASPPGLSFQIEVASGGAERYTAELCCVEQPERWDIALRFDPARLSAEEAARLAARLAALVEDAAARPDAEIAALNLLGQEERHAILVAFNRTARAFPKDRCIHELFEEQARRTPAREAVRFRGQTRCYAELNARANRLAHALIARGVGPEARVGLFLERSVDTLAAILGVLKAGGAYVPLDPLYPTASLAFMASDAGLTALVTQTSLLGALEFGNDLPVVSIDEGGDAPSGPLAQDPGRRALPSNLAYVIYTSGSTGRPKGVMIEHCSAVNLAHALDEAIYRGEGAPLKVSLNASLSFDASVKQWLMLLLGHTIHVVPEEVRGDPGELLAFVREEALDVLDCTPSQLTALLDQGFAEEPAASPALLLVGGEPIDERVWRRLASGARPRLINVYGPTECTVDATACAAQVSPERPTIGAPLANVRAYVLDERGAPVPLGVAGELYIGGAGVGRGYLGQPALTASRFIADAFDDGTAGGARLYRTGDAARFRADGRLEILGRLDDQMKIRGYRIELGEIEATLAAHPAVTRAIAAVRQMGPGQLHLIGYVVLRDGTSGPECIQALRDHLRARLPEHMVPYQLVPIERVPLTANGKVDRAALPEPASGLVEVGAEELPQTEIERQIAAIWQDVLRVPRVGLHQNFFDLGGHSLLLVRLFEQLRAAFGAELSMVELFRHPTVSAMAERLRRHEEEAPRALDHVDERVQRQLAARHRRARGERG